MAEEIKEEKVEETKKEVKEKVKKPLWKRILKAILIILLVLILVVGGYLLYVVLSYDRIPDNQELKIDSKTEEIAQVGTEYKLISYNIGFAAYTPDFGFFMDGGTEAQAASEESVRSVMGGIASLLKEENADFYMIEEVDRDSTRAHHVNEAPYLTDALSDYDSVYAINWDSPFLYYPLIKPHGAALSSIMTFSRFDMTESIRRSLPLEDSIMKYIDLDRCYTVSRVPTNDGHDLVLFTVHLSAYSSDGKIAEEQLKMLIAQMQEEYEKGNYCIAGGDFNKDMLGDGTTTSAEIFGVDGDDYTWAQPIPEEMFDNTNISKVVPFDENNKVPSCRNADGPYNEDQYVVTVDGFLVSDNVTVKKSDVIDTGFKYSDHNPVYLTFILGEADD